MKRTHTCGAFRKENVGQTVSVCGWIQRRRDHGGVIFIDLRDRSGMVQMVFDPEVAGSYFPVAEKVRPEYVLSATGEVRLRPEGQDNPNMATGEIEIYVTEVEILNPSKTPPFLIEDRNCRRILNYVISSPWLFAISSTAKASGKSKRRCLPSALPKALVTSLCLPVFIPAVSLRCRSRLSFSNSF